MVRGGQALSSGRDCQLLIAGRSMSLMSRETLRGKYTPEDQHPWTWSDIFIDNRQIL